MKQKYLNNYAALKSLPIVQELIAKQTSKKENKNLRSALSLLGEIKCKQIYENTEKDIDIISVYSDDLSENITYSVENKDNTVYTDDSETRMLKKSDNNSNTNSKNIKNTIIKMENISDDEPTVIGDTSPMCWSTHNSNQNLQEEEEDLKERESG